MGSQIHGWGLWGTSGICWLALLFLKNLVDELLVFSILPRRTNIIWPLLIARYLAWVANYISTVVPDIPLATGVPVSSKITLLILIDVGMIFFLPYSWTEFYTHSILMTAIGAGLRVDQKSTWMSELTFMGKGIGEFLCHDLSTYLLYSLAEHVWPSALQQRPDWRTRVLCI